VRAHVSQLRVRRSADRFPNDRSIGHRGFANAFAFRGKTEQTLRGLTARRAAIRAPTGRRSAIGQRLEPRGGFR